MCSHLPLTNIGKAHSSNNAKTLSNKNHIWHSWDSNGNFNGMCCISLPCNAARASLGEFVTSELYFQEPVKDMYELAGQASHAHLLSTFATPDVNSDGDAFPINRKKAQIARRRSNLHLAKTYFYLHCKTFPPPLHRHFKQTGMLVKPSVKSLRGPSSSFCCVSNAQCCT